MAGFRKRPHQLGCKERAIMGVQISKALELVALFAVIAGKGDILPRCPPRSGRNAG